MLEGAASSVYQFDAASIGGAVVPMAAYRGHVLLIVNVASQCGFTPQYRGLEALYRQYRESGLVVLGFPCNQFGHQEPGTDADIETFCAETYDVSFPMFARIEVNGPRAHPLYQWLKEQKRGLFGASIKWNFTKFLVGRDGAVIARFGPTEKPEAIGKDVSLALAAESRTRRPS